MSEVKVKYYGYIYDASGYGYAARGYIHALHTAGLPLSLVNLSKNGVQERDALVDSFLNKPMKPDIHLFHGIPWGWERHIANLKNTIAMTVWETDTMPYHWRRLLNRIREVWLPCEFNVKAFAKSLQVPVFKLPHTIPANGFDKGQTDSRRLDSIRKDDFVFYGIFEWQDRKNPLGLIEAYLKAFEKDEGTLLFIKTNSNASSVAYRDVDRLRNKIGSHARIEIACGGWSDAEICALHQRGNCYISLHKGEGWCIPLFIAASSGKPVIATNYSGPTEYLSPNEHNLVRFQLTPVSQRYTFYNSKMHWANPDVLHASELIRWVFYNQDVAINKAKKAAYEIQEKYSLKNIGEMAKERLLATLDIVIQNPKKKKSVKLMPAKPIPPEWYDEDYYETGQKSNWDNGYTWNLFAGLFKLTAEYICECFPSAESFLDVGCAKGFLIKTLRDKGRLAYGFDHSPWAFSHAEKDARPYITLSGVDDIEYSRKFDILIAFETFSHLTESQAKGFVQRAKNWINTCLFATIPTFENDREIEKYVDQDNDPSHILLKSRSWWHDLFISAGWKQDGLHQILQHKFQKHALPRSMNWQIYLYSSGQ